MKSAVNKSYLRGISDGMELIKRPTPENFEKYVGRQQVMLFFIKH